MFKVYSSTVMVIYQPVFVYQAIHCMQGTFITMLGSLQIWCRLQGDMTLSPLCILRQVACLMYYIFSAA